MKGNIGHLDAAAGVAGLIKTALMLRNREFVPSLNFEAPNPHIAFEGGPFFVNTVRAPWPDAVEARRAGVTSLGVGGTNAHVVLEEPPARAAAGARSRPELLTLAARSPSALERMRERLANHLAANPDASLADVAFTLQRGRRHFPHQNRRRLPRSCRRAGPSVRAALASREPGRGTRCFAFRRLHVSWTRRAIRRDGARALSAVSPTFRAELDRCAEVLAAESIDLIGALYGPDDPSQPERLARTGVAQPAIFSVSYALARLWQSWGVNAETYIGHSVGEFVAACLAGVFSLSDALRLIAARGRLMQQLPSGGMLSVRLSEADVQPLIGDGVVLAAINSPTNVVLTGPIEALQAIARQLEALGTAHRLLHTSHAFHSPMMDPMIGPFMERFGERHAARAGEALRLERDGRLDPCAKKRRRLNTGRATRANLFGSPPRIKTLTASGAPILLEVGPGGGLPTLALQTVRGLAGRTFSVLARGRRSVGRRRDHALCARETLGERRCTRLGRRSRTGHVHASRCRPIRSNAVGTGSMRPSEGWRARSRLLRRLRWQSRQFQ